MTHLKNHPLSVLTFLLVLFSCEAQARQAINEQEVYLTFRYQNVVNTYVTAIYRDDHFYLPQTELFSLLGIGVSVGASVSSGQYLDKGAYSIDFLNGVASLGDEEYLMTPEQYFVRELDYYIDPVVFLELFGLEFDINFNSLNLTLETSDVLPVVQQRDRARQREDRLRNEQSFERTFYRLLYNRNHHLLYGGFLDYNLTANISKNLNSYLLNSSVGIELLGGDFQGNIFGNWSAENSVLRSQNLRWQYGIENSRLLSRITVGQTSSIGLRTTSITGFHITNSPLEPRYLFDDYIIDGSTTPNSEVELYRNNALVGFQTSDNSGDYRFEVPLTYGTTRYNLRVYTPDGNVHEEMTRLQVPFNFNPPGVLDYNISAGALNNPIPGTPLRGYMGRGGAMFGITNWLSASSSVEYYENFHEDIPTVTGALNARVFENYLISVSAASQAFYRVSSNVYYGNGVNMSLDYTKYNYQGGLYNSANNESMIRGNIFIPLSISDIPFFFRATVSNEKRGTSGLTRYRLEANSIFGRLNLRLGFQDSQTGDLSLKTTAASRMTATARYSFPRTSDTPGLFKGMFIRTRANYSPHTREFLDAEMQISRRFLGEGRIQFSYGNNFSSNYNYFRANISFDLNSIRANTAVRSSRGNTNITQSIRGSIGLDPRNARLIVSDRQQVGHAGVAVRMFVDINNNGTYDDSDQLIFEPAVRVDRAGGLVKNIGGINYVTQLQPYRQYNLTVNKTALLNPLLVPETEQFSFISDPNQFKMIDIPLYYSGVVEGQVFRQSGATQTPLSGLRLIMTQTDNDDGVDPFSQQLTTFSDGTFYTWEVPPGDFQISVDPVQLELLQAESIPDTLHFTVRALAEGDFVNGLRIVVTPRNQDEAIQNPSEVEDGPSGTNQETPTSSEIDTSDAANDTQLNQGLPQQGPAEPEISIENVTIPTQTNTASPDSSPESQSRLLIDGESTGQVDLGEEDDNTTSFETTGGSTEDAETRPSVQLGAFSTRLNAERYADSLLVDHGLETTIVESSTSSLTLVRSLPVPASISPQAYLESLKELGLGEGIYLVSP